MQYNIVRRAPVRDWYTSCQRSKPCCTKVEETNYFSLNSPSIPGIGANLTTNYYEWTIILLWVVQESNLSQDNAIYLDISQTNCVAVCLDWDSIF